MRALPSILTTRVPRLTLGALWLALAAFVPAAEAQEMFKVGIVSPNSGSAARYGAFAWRGAQLARDEINAAGGVRGKKVELFQGDSQCVPTEGVSAMQRMVAQDRVRVVIGDVCSSVTLAMQPIAESNSVVLLNAASSNPDITYRAGVGGFKWTFRNYPTDENRALIVLQYAAEQKKFKKFAVLSVDSDYGRGAIKLTKKYLERFAVEIVTEDYYKDNETDFRSTLTRIRRSGAQAILMYGLADTAVVVARQMTESGLAGKVPFVGSAEFNNPATIRAAPVAMNGAIEAAAWIPDYDTPRNKQFVEAYKARFGEVPNVHAYTYWETLRLAAKAAGQARGEAATDLRDAVAGIRYDGIMGPVMFDDHNQADLPMILFETEGTTPVIKGTFSSRIDYPGK